MKKIYLFLISSFCFLSFTQSENSFPIELKQKIILKITQKNSSEFEFTEIKREPIDKIVKVWGGSEDVVSERGENETIEFYFCQATNNGVESTVLLMNCRSKFSFKFDTEIQNSENSEFKTVPNVGTHTNSITQEAWGWKIKQIRISNIRRKK